MQKTVNWQSFIFVCKTDLNKANKKLIFAFYNNLHVYNVTIKIFSGSNRNTD